MRALVRAAVAGWPIFAAGAILAANSAAHRDAVRAIARAEPEIVCEFRPILGCWGTPEIIQAAGE